MLNKILFGLTILLVTQMCTCISGDYPGNYYKYPDGVVSKENGGENEH